MSKFKIQNLILVITSATFAVGVLLTSVWQGTLQVGPIDHQERQVLAASITINVADSEKEEVDYYLAYPGILPDHFVYPVKMVRDRILLFLTTEPLKKAELILLFADKRIGAAQVLLKKGEIELATTIAGKAEKYLERAADQEKVAREAQKETKTFLEKLAKASLKHEEILLVMISQVDEVNKSALVELLAYSRQVNEEINELLRGN